MNKRRLELPGTNPHRSETRVRELDAADLDIEVPASQADRVDTWEELRSAIGDLSREGTQIAVATGDGTTATGIKLPEGSSKMVHPLELSVWKAFSESQSRITHVLINSSDEEYTPCGRCLQVLADYSESATIRLTNPSEDQFKEVLFEQASPLSLNKNPKEGGGDSLNTANNDSLGTGDSNSMSIPDDPPLLDIEVEDSVPVEYVRLNAPVYHLKYQNHHETFCGTTLANRDWVSSSEAPDLLDPCKQCHGETSRETVEEKRERLRRELAQNIGPVKETTENANAYTREELEAILDEIPATTPSDPFNASDLRKRLAECIVDVHTNEKEPLEFSRDEMEAILESLDGEGVISDKPHLFVHTSAGRAARLNVTELELQHRSGKGQTGVSLRDSELLDSTLSMNPREQLYVLTNMGQIHQVAAHQVVSIDRGAKPSPLSNIINLDQGEALQSVFSCESLEDSEYVILGTKNGYIKRTATSEFENIHAGGIRAIKLDDDDELRGARLLDSEGSILMTTGTGRTIRFDAADVRAMGRTARGVNGIEVDDGEEVVAVNAVDESLNGDVLTVTEEGYGKRTSIDKYRTQTRKGRGLLDIATGDRNGPVIGVEIAASEDEFIGITERGRTIRINIDDISVQGRNTMGVKIMGLNPEDSMAKFSVFDD